MRGDLVADPVAGGALVLSLMMSGDMLQLQDLSTPHHLHLVDLAPADHGPGVATGHALDADTAPLLDHHIAIRRLAVDLDTGHITEVSGTVSQEHSPWAG